MKVQIDKEQFDNYDQRLNNEIAKAEKYKNHLWTAIIMYKVNPQAILNGDQIIFDTENLLTGQPNIGCYICEQPFSIELLNRKCRG